MSDTPTDVVDLPATRQRALLAAKEISARELLDAHIQRISERNPALNAIVAYNPDVARPKAAAIDDAVAAGQDVGPLAGLVTAYKDLVETSEFVTTFGVGPLADNRPANDALVVQQIEAAGALAVGKTNVPQLGAGSHTFNPVYGTTLNAFDTTRTAGGSSGGAAVALATGMVAVADGSDFGGSLRNPAAWGNVIGFRPSAGVVPVGGPGNAWNPMPVYGPMGRNMDDLLLLLSVMAQPHSADPLSRGLDLSGLDDASPTKPLRVAWSANLGGLPVEDEVAATLNGFRDRVESLGWEITEDEPDFSGADEVFHTIRSFNYLSRADAFAPFIEDLKETIRHEIELGRSLSVQDVAKAYGHLKVLWDRANTFFADYDLLIGPVTQVMPFPADVEYPMEVAGQTMKVYTEWMYSCCRITSLGVPALSLPAGFGPSGLPVGAQLVGRPHGDVDLLAAARLLEATA